MNINLQQITPETPVNHVQGGFHHLGGYLDSPNANLLIPSSLFRPWDTPESLSPTSSNVPPESLSPTSSNLAPSDTSSPTSSLPSSPEDVPSSELSPTSQSIYSSNGQCLYKLEPLEPVSLGQGVSLNEDKDNLDFIAGKESVSRKRKRKEKFLASAASPVLAKKSRVVTKGEFPPCGVCGAESTGVHYGAPVCEGCKVWFWFIIISKNIS